MRLTPLFLLLGGLASLVQAASFADLAAQAPECGVSNRLVDLFDRFGLLMQLHRCNASKRFSHSLHVQWMIWSVYVPTRHFSV